MKHPTPTVINDIPFHKSHSNRVVVLVSGVCSSVLLHSVFLFGCCFSCWSSSVVRLFVVLKFRSVVLLFCCSHVVVVVATIIVAVVATVVVIVVLLLLSC